MGGWDQLRARLVGDGDGKPMIVCFSTCLDSIRTLPAMQHDQARPEDMDSNLEDHAADEWRYACMSRPWIKTVAPRGNARSYRRPSLPLSALSCCYKFGSGAPAALRCGALH
jgi:hypothetical protein